MAYAVAAKPMRDVLCGKRKGTVFMAETDGWANTTDPSFVGSTPTLFYNRLF